MIKQLCDFVIVSGYCVKQISCFVSNWFNIECCKMKQIDDWRDIALPKDLVMAPRVRTLGVSSVVSGFGKEYDALGSNNLQQSG